MKVKELIEKLSVADQDALVILSRDSEGNGFMPLEDVSLRCVYQMETKRSGEVYFPDDDSELDENSSPAVLMWPR